MVHELNCTHPLASKAGNVSESEIYSLLLEEEQQEFVLKVPALIVMIIYVCLGIPGNILVIIIYYFRFRSSSTKTFIMSLSVFDWISCFLGIPFEMVDLRYDVELDVPALCKVMRFIITFCACASTLVLLSVAADRFRRIVLPFKKQMNTKQSKIIVGVMIATSFIISVPALVLYGRNTKTYRSVTLVDCTIDDQWQKTIFANGYQFVLGMLWVSSILVLCVMYGVIIYKIRKLEIRRLNLTAQSKASVYVSKFNSTNAHIIKRKESTASNPTDFRSSPAANNGRVQHSKNLLERSNSNPEEKEKSEDGGKALGGSSRQPNPINRLFSRDVNPIYEEEDEANKSSAAIGVCDSIEETTSFNSENFIQEEIVEDGETIILVTKHDDVKYVPDLESSEDNPVIRRTKITDGDLAKRLSRSVPCLLGLSVISDDFENSDKEHDDKAPFVERTKTTKNKLKFKRSNSLPMSSENEGKSVYFINQDFDAGETENMSSPPDKESTLNPCKNNFYLSNRHDNIVSPKQTNKHNDVNVENDDFDGNRNSIETSNRLEVTAGKNRYASDDRSLDCITSKSDQTNGSILTLNDSRVPQNRRRKISAYSLTRQASFTSNNNYSHDRSSKTNSYCSQNSTPARIHKTSIASYTGKMSTVSTTAKELKPSRIAMIMFYVTMGHILSYLPHLAIQCHRVVGRQDITRLLCNSVYFAFYHLFLRSIYLNNAINPVIYSYSNLQFRCHVKEFLKNPLAFCRKKTNRPYTMDSAHSFTAD